MYMLSYLKVTSLYLFLMGSILLPSVSYAEDLPQIKYGQPSIGTGYTEHSDGRIPDPLPAADTVNNYYYYGDDGYSCYDNWGNYYGEYCSGVVFPFLFWWGGQRYYMNNWDNWNNWNRRYYSGRNIGNRVEHHRGDRIDRRGDRRDNVGDRRDNRRGDGVRDRGGRDGNLQRGGPRGDRQGMRAGGPRGGQGMRSGGPRGGQGMRAGGGGGMRGGRGGGGRGGRR